MKNFRVRSRAGLWAMVVGAVALVALTMIGCFSGEIEVTTEENIAGVSPEMLPSLVMGPEELPWDVVLAAWGMGSDVPPHILKPFEGQAKYKEGWSSRPTGKPGDMKSPEYSIKIVVAIASSPEEAVRVAQKEVASVAGIIPEITHDGSRASFADRAWSDGIRIVFTRGNVIGDILMFQKGGVEDRHLLFTLAAGLGGKIDAALAGKPEPVPVLPLAADHELRVDVEGAWKMRDLGTRLWRAESTTIAIYDTNGIPRSLPAKRVGTDDYVVPLRYLAAIIGPRARVKRSGDEANVTLMGKALVFNKGKSEMRVDQRAEQLNRPVEFAEGEVLVPLTSVVSNTSDQRITWEHRGTIMVGRVE